MCNSELYNSNETMKLIGEQSIANIAGNTELFYQFEDIIKAHKLEPLLPLLQEFSIDVYQLGYIAGKRAERARKRGNNACKEV